MFHSFPFAILKVCSSGLADAWITSRYCTDLGAGPDRCGSVSHQVPGANTGDSRGSYLPCQRILLPENKISEFSKTTGLSTGGFATIDRSTLYRTYCEGYRSNWCKGTIYEDVNLNGIIDFEDPVLENVNFHTHGKVFKSDSNGKYQVYLGDQERFKFQFFLDSIDNLDWGLYENELIFDYRFDDADKFDILLINKNKIVEQLTLDAGVISFQTCDSTTVNVSFCNYGLKDIEEATLKIPIQNNFEFLSSNPTPDSIGNGNLFYSINNLLIDSCGNINLNLIINCDSIHPNLIEISAISQISNELDTTEIKIAQSQLDFQITSIVPEINSKVNYDVEIGQSIVYQIDFRNSSSDSIYLNEIRLVSSENLDFDQIEILSTSHSFFRDENADRNLFDCGFYLPPATVDHEKSKGYLRFSAPPNYQKEPNFEIITSAYAEPFGLSNQDTLKIGPNVWEENRDTSICVGEPMDTLIFDFVNQRNLRILNFSVTELQTYKDTLEFEFENFPVGIRGIEVFGDTIWQENYFTQFGCDSNFLVTVFDISIPSSVNEISFINLNLYPNPTKRQLHLDFNASRNSEFDFKIMNIYGGVEIKSSEEIQIGENNFLFETDTLQSGVYFISIENPKTGEVQFVSKFIKI